MMNMPADGSLRLFSDNADGKVRIPENFDSYVELQQAGFIESEDDLKKLRTSLIETHRLHYELRYREPNGIEYANALSEGFTQVVAVPFLQTSEFAPKAPPSPSVKLTEKGRNGARIIVDAVADVISREPEKKAETATKEAVKAIP